MVRKVGYGEDPERPSVSSNLTATPGPSSKRQWFKQALGLLIMLVMLGFGLSLIFTGLAEGDGLQVAFAMVWSVLAITMIAKAVLRRLGLVSRETPTTKSRWSLDSDE